MAPLFVLSSSLMLAALKWLASRKSKKPSSSEGEPQRDNSSDDGALSKVRDALEETQAAMIPSKLGFKKRVRIAAIYVVFLLQSTITDAMLKLFTCVKVTAHSSSRDRPNNTSDSRWARHTCSTTVSTSIAPAKHTLCGNFYSHYRCYSSSALCCRPSPSTTYLSGIKSSRMSITMMR